MRPNCDVLYLAVGEKYPFLTTSKATFERVGRALLMCNAKLFGSISMGDWEKRSSFIMNIEIPAANREKFEDIVKCPTTYHHDLMLGWDTIKQVKWSDAEGNRYHSPYPDKSDKL